MCFIMSDAGCSLLVTGYWIFDTGYLFSALRAISGRKAPFEIPSSRVFTTIFGMPAYISFIK